MPVDVALNTFIRNAVRSDLQLPRPQILGLDLPFPEDTDDDTINLFRRSGVLGSKEGEARAARAAAQEAAQQLLARPGGTLGINVGTLIAGSSFLAGSSPIVPLRAFTIKDVTLFIASSTAPGAGVTSGVFAVLVSQTDDLSLPQVQSDINTNIAGNLFADGIRSNPYSVRNDSGMQVVVPVGYAVTFSPAFVKVLISTPGGVVFPDATVSIEELNLPAVLGSTFAPTGGRLSININTAGAARRGRRTPTPRAAMIRVTQGGRILNQRTIAWESLAAPIRADWFNRQVGGQGDPSIVWIP